jgi:prepilin-type N-terminal cleavage/methylation domain-containing protein
MTVRRTFHLRVFAPWRRSSFSRSHQLDTKTQSGFTLLELVIALVVMGLAVAVSYPALSRGGASLHLRATGRDVLNTLRYARETAITQQTGSRVVVDRDAQKITLTDELGDGARALSLRRDVKIYRMALAGGEITEGPLVIRFLPNGSSDNAEILLRSDTGGILRVVTDPMTGGARIVTDSAVKNR